MRRIIDLEASTGLRYPPTMRVDQLLRTYFYGDVIHFGEGRDELEALNVDAFSHASNRMALYRGASGSLRTTWGTQHSCSRFTA